MRKLGVGQSVIFCIPSEIRTKILTHTRKPSHANIDVSDVLSWAISETWEDMRRSMPLWAAQGQRYERQRALWAEASSDGKLRMSKGTAQAFLEEESQSLETRYKPRTDTEKGLFNQDSQNENLSLIIQRCQDFELMDIDSATLQEEQERELSPEIEQERQVQKPASAKPLEHCVHRDLRSFVSTGAFLSGSTAYRPAFEALRNTSAAAYLDVAQFPRDIFVTADFASTVQVSGTSYISDVYQRPVQWILTSTRRNVSSDVTVKHLVIISPHEAQALLPSVEQSNFVTLHLYAPRANLSFHALDGLDLFTVPKLPTSWVVPPRFIIALNLFAGQLYLNSFNEYVEVCNYLSLASGKTEEGCVVDADGFIVSGPGASKSGFKQSPVKFLKVLMTKIRRNCEDIGKTHMGAVLDGRLLRPSDFGEPEEQV